LCFTTSTACYIVTILNRITMKIFCVGRNYSEHAKELGNAVPEEPVIFMKPKSALLQANTPFYYPEFTNELHYEVEIVLRICKNGKYVQNKQASKYFNAISVGIDFTARDVQAELKKKGLPWEKAKAWDNSAVIAPWIELTPEMMRKSIRFSLKKNGVVVQQGDTKDMIFSFNDIISHISNYFSLNIGDAIFTGTPPGVGECVVGDVLEGFIEDKRMFELTIK
jgi:2-keto-4-pentenoate hydratase/2-oxohepta-3-ene-1,7-dioic acid hydratase in catechol pathway